MRLASCFSVFSCTITIIHLWKCWSIFNLESKYWLLSRTYCSSGGLVHVYFCMIRIYKRVSLYVYRLCVNAHAHICTYTRMCVDELTSVEYHATTSAAACLPACLPACLLSFSAAGRVWLLSEAKKWNDVAVRRDRGGYTTPLRVRSSSPRKSISARAWIRWNQTPKAMTKTLMASDNRMTQNQSIPNI